MAGYSSPGNVTPRQLRSIAVRSPRIATWRPRTGGDVLPAPPGRASASAKASDNELVTLLKEEMGASPARRTIALAEHLRLGDEV